MKQLIAALCLFVGISVSVSAQSIIEAAETQADLSTFVTAVKAADLVETLSGEEAVTVFAPSNDAFAALPAGQLESLLMPENKEQLVKILSYHVIPGKVLSADVEDGTSPTVQGEEINVAVADTGVKINDANVTTADIEASNGVVHIIDQVVMPPSQMKN
ncbi:MAG: fasciclin domain-containing protein [Saprospiraceae bacterium]|nr:fasciclin domain-containing protein [Saprospiraceae bacterium]